MILSNCLHIYFIVTFISLLLSLKYIFIIIYFQPDAKYTTIFTPSLAWILCMFWKEVLNCEPQYTCVFFRGSCFSVPSKNGLGSVLTWSCCENVGCSAWAFLRNLRGSQWSITPSVFYLYVMCLVYFHFVAPDNLILCHSFYFNPCYTFDFYIVISFVEKANAWDAYCGAVG